MRKNQLTNAFIHFFEMRIVEIESVRSNQPDLLKIRKRMDEILKKISSRFPIEADELECLQHEFLAEMYHAIYRQAFSDAMQFPSIAQSQITISSEVASATCDEKLQK